MNRQNPSWFCFTGSLVKWLAGDPPHIWPILHQPYSFTHCCWHFFWVTKISHYLAYLHWIPQKLRSVFTVVGMFKSEALIFLDLLGICCEKVRLLWSQVLAPFTSNITAVYHCGPFCQTATGQTQLHYMWLIIFYNSKFCMNKVTKFVLPWISIIWLVKIVATQARIQRGF